jgi:predicted dehydrogenase
MKKIRLGVIGCGGMEGTHEHGLKQVADRIEVTATVDLIEERARKAAEQLGAKRFATNHREVFDDVDAVMIVLPHDLHYPVGMECLKAGKHVLMEKPLANTESECLDLIHAAREHDRVLMVAYVMRYHPLVTKLKELIDSKKYGDIFQMSIWTEQHTQRPAGDWHNSARRLGGGQFFSHGCHYIDLLLWYMGRPVSGTHVGTRMGTPWMEREGTSNISISFATGALGYHFGTWGARGSRLKYSFHGHCTDGLLEAQFSTGKLFLHRNDKDELLFEAGAGKPTGNQLEHFYDCVVHGHKPLTDGPGSIQGLRTIWRLYEAEANGVVADLRGLGLDEAVNL